MKAKDTYYNNNYFRSRLEAKWAVCFDTLGVHYRYESVKFELSDGSVYMPDFYFPRYDFYAEVKPEERVDERWALFDEPLVLMFGDHPHFRPMPTNRSGYFKHASKKVIPFANLKAPSNGYFWWCEGNEDWSNLGLFRWALFKANTYRFEEHYNRPARKSFLRFPF